MSLDFKVGDKARVVIGTHFDFGEIVTIDSVDKMDVNYPYHCDSNCGMSWWVKADEIEKIATSTKPKLFKVGDKARVVIDTHFNFGAVVTIDTVNKGGFYYPYRCVDDSGTCEWIQADEIEAVAESKLFKVGDKIRIRSWESMEKEFGFDGKIIKCKCGFTSNMKTLCGHTAYIKSLDEWTTNVVSLERWDSGLDTCYSFSTDMIEHVCEEEDNKKEVKDTDRQFKIGDRVRLTRDFQHAEKGAIGIIKSLSNPRVGVEFEDFSEGHSCDGNCKSGSGYWVDTTALEIVPSSNSKFYDYLMTYSEANLEKFISYLYSNSVSFLEHYHTKEKIANAIDTWVRSSSNVQPRKAILNEMCKHVGIRDGYRTNMLAEVDKIAKSSSHSCFYDFLLTLSHDKLIGIYAYLDEYEFLVDVTRVGSELTDYATVLDEWCNCNDETDIDEVKHIFKMALKENGLSDFNDKAMSAINKNFGITDAKKSSTDDIGSLAVTTSTNDKTKFKEKKEDTNMFNTTNLMENFMPSFATGDKFAFTMGGKTAVKRANGEYVVYNFETETIENQADFVLKDEDFSKMFILMPTLGSKLVAGDLINNKETFYTVLGQSRGKISTVNMNTSANSSISKETNIIFGEKMYKKVVSLFNMNGTADSAFGGGATGGMNPMMMAMMMGKGDGDGDSMMKNVMLMQMMGGGMGGATGAMNPMVMAMMMSGKDGGSSDSMMKMLMMTSMMGGGANPFAAMMGGATTPVVAPVKSTVKSPKKITQKTDKAATEKVTTPIAEKA